MLRRRIAGLTAALLLGGCAAQERAALAPLSARSALAPERAEAIDRMLSQFEALGMFNGVVTIDLGGEIVFQRAYGFADYERRLPFRDDSVFRIASVSKSMTDAALAALVARRQVSMSDTVARFLPSFPNGDRITIEQIVTHRSGIAHTNDLPWGDATQPLTLDEIVARLAETPLDFEPGAQRSYSNGGYAVLAKILEVITGKPYPRLMQELVFDPLGMRNSGAFVDSRIPLPHGVRGYEPSDNIGGRRAPRPYLPETRPGGGSLYASAGDVLRFFQAASRGRLEGSSAVPALFAGNGAGGRSPGFYFDVHNDRPADLIVVSAGNTYAAEFRWAENIAALALGQEPLFSPPAADLSRPLNEAWLGSYAWNDATVTLSRGAQGQVLLTDPDGATVALIPLSDGGYLEPMFFSICRLTSQDHIRCGRMYEGEGFVMDLDRRP